MKVSKVSKEFIVYIRKVRHNSPYTIRAYTHYLNRFSEFTKAIPIEDLNATKVIEFKDQLAKQNLSLKTQAYHLHAVRSFLNYCNIVDIKTLDPKKIEIGKYRDNKMEFLTKLEVEKLCSVINTNDIRGIRDMAIIQTFYASGIRVGELARLNELDIDLEQRQFYVQGKGGERRIAFLTQEAVKWLWEYRKHRTDPFEPLFISHGRSGSKHRRLSITMIQQIVRNYAQKAQIHKKVSCHTLRHSFATTLLNNGADLMSIKEMLGHKHLSSTQIYLHVTNERLKKLHNEFLG